MRSIGFMLALVFLFLLSGCKVPRLNSLLLDREIILDGSDSEWENAKVNLEKAKVSLGFYNDAKFLYLCIIPGDPSKSAAVLNQGLIVWFDAEGQRRRSFGIGYPTGMLGRGIMPQAPGPGADSLEIEAFQKSFDFFEDEMELLTSDKNVVKRESLRGVPGIDVKAGFRTGRFVYELKVPLTTENGRFAYAVGVDTCRFISVGFETPVSERDAEMGPRPGTGSSAGSGAGGGGGSGRGSRGGRGGSRGGGGNQDVTAEQPSPGFGTSQGPEPVSLWIQLRLAKLDNQ